MMVMNGTFTDSVDRLSHAEQEITIVIDRPKKLVDIIGACLKLRFAFLRWIEGHLEFFSWMTPTTPTPWPASCRPAWLR